MRRASSGEDGSSTGIFAKRPNRRVSCSVCDEWGPGSSAQMMTKPPFTPMYAELIIGSAATFRPTCFMITAARLPV